MSSLRTSLFVVIGLFAGATASEESHYMLLERHWVIDVDRSIELTFDTSEWDERTREQIERGMRGAEFLFHNRKMTRVLPWTPTVGPVEYSIQRWNDHFVVEIAIDSAETVLAISSLTKKELCVEFYHLEDSEMSVRSVPQRKADVLECYVPNAD